MGDSSTCLLHGFSYASAIPNEYKQGNPIHILGESISFGRYTAESLSWEKWSTFSHKKYVEEAEMYAKPGSVAQKKAFFEAHYKRIAALKAAALLEQQNAAALAAENAVKDKNDNDDENEEEEEEERILSNSHSKDEFERGEEQEIVKIDDYPSSIVTESTESEEGGKISVITGNGVSEKRNLENQDTISASEASESTQMERPLLKHSVDCEEVTSKRRSSPSSLKSSILHKTWRTPYTPARLETPHLKNVMRQSSSKSNVESSNNEKRMPRKDCSTPTSLRDLLNLVHSKEPDKQPAFPASSFSSRHCSTPLKTPAPTSTKSASTYPAATPLSENRRMKTPIDSSATGRKTSGPKWHILSAVCPKSLSAYRNKLQSPTVSTPFTLRTEERAARRKQKLEEKFNSTEAQKMQIQRTLKEKAGDELRKLSCSLCFNARPLPDFNKETETPDNHTKKTPTAKQPQTTVLGRSVSKGTVSMPPSTRSAHKNLFQKNVVNQSKLPNRSLRDRIAHENASPNIQQ